MTLRLRVDDHFVRAVERSPESFACRSGCDACCHRRFGVFEIEADRIRLALAELAHERPELRATVRANATDPSASDRCALLVDGRCAVYDARPMICRVHGLPTAVPAEDGSTRLDVCPLNFRTTAPPRPSVMATAAVNEPLAVMAEMYAPGGVRVDLADLAAAANDEKNLDSSVDPGSV